MAADGVPEKNLNDIPLTHHDIGSVYYQMDRVVASATLPEKYSFRLNSKGRLPLLGKSLFGKLQGC